MSSIYLRAVKYGKTEYLGGERITQGEVIDAYPSQAEALAAPLPDKLYLANDPKLAEGCIVHDQAGIIVSLCHYQKVLYSRMVEATH
jgi:hypothetical protein